MCNHFHFDIPHVVLLHSKGRDRTVIIESYCYTAFIKRWGGELITTSKKIRPRKLLFVKNVPCAEDNEQFYLKISQVFETFPKKSFFEEKGVPPYLEMELS